MGIEIGGLLALIILVADVSFRAHLDAVVRRPRNRGFLPCPALRAGDGSQENRFHRSHGRGSGGRYKSPWPPSACAFFSAWQSTRQSRKSRPR